MAALIFVFAFTGLAASSVLLVEYTSASAIFCNAGGGCDIVRASKYAEIFGIKTPWLGLAFFGVALVLALVPARRLLVTWAAAGAVGALIFFGIQLFELHAICVYCAVADGSALLLFVTSLAGRRKLMAFKPALALAALVAAAGVVAGPFLVARSRPPVPVVEAAATSHPLPPTVLREQRPGVVTIVELTDFECPFCRRLHQTLSAILGDYGDKVRLVRMQQPLAELHPHATTAAHAFCCAEEVSAAAADRMAEALYSAPPEELTPAGCEALAVMIGLDTEQFKSCMASDRPAKKVAADQVEARAAGVDGEAPVFFVGKNKHRGAEPAGVIRAAIDRELARR